MLWENVLISFIHMLLSSFPSRTYWRKCLFSIVYIFFFFCHRLIDCRFMGLFLGCSLFCAPSEPVCMIGWIIRGSHSFLSFSSRTKTKFGELYDSIPSFLHILILVKAELPEDFPCRLFPTSHMLPTQPAHQNQDRGNAVPGWAYTPRHRQPGDPLWEQGWGPSPHLILPSLAGKAASSQGDETSLWD